MKIQIRSVTHSDMMRKTLTIFEEDMPLNEFIITSHKMGDEILEIVAQLLKYHGEHYDTNH